MKSNIENLKLKLANNEDKPAQNKELATGEEFLKLLLKLQPDEFCALAKFLGVRLLTDDVDPETKKAIARDAYDIIDDCIDHYALLDRTDRRFVLKYLRRTLRAR